MSSSSAFPESALLSCRRLLAELRQQGICRLAPSVELILWDWSQLNNLSQSSLRRLTWQLLNPRESMPLGLIWWRIVDKLTLGRISWQMLNGRGSSTMLTAGGWFRYAAHAIMIRPSMAIAYFRRAINGTLNSGGLRSKLYQGFDADGGEVTYNLMHGVIDTELAQRLKREYHGAKLLQGILIFRCMDAGASDDESGWSLARQLIEQALGTGEVVSGLAKEGQVALIRISQKGF